MSRQRNLKNAKRNLDMSIDLAPLSWPVARLGEALETLARKSGFPLRPVESLVPPRDLALDGGEQLGRWIAAAAGCLGLEVEPLEMPYAEVERLVCTAAPALLQLPGKSEPHFLLLLADSKAVSVLDPDLAVHHLQPAIVCTALCQELRAPLVTEVDQLLSEAGVPVRRQARAREAIRRELLGAERLGSAWLLRLPPGSSFWQQLRQARLPRHLAALVGAHTVQYFLWLFSWWMVGQGALQGRLDWGWLLAWALLLLTVVPFRLYATWLQGLLAIGAGGLLKQRLLFGALRLEPDEIRHQGIGQLLGRVLEAEAIESLALSGGLLALVSSLELILAALILRVGAGGWLHLLLLCGWVAVTCLIGWQYFQRRRHWTSARLAMTHDLVERMAGHRTRLAQEGREHWHEGEDSALARYVELSRAMDRNGALLVALVPRGWLAVGVLGLAPAFAANQGSPALLAVSLGGLLLAFRALQKLTAGLSHLASAALAWTQVAPLFHAATRPELSGSPSLIFASRSAPRRFGEKHVVIEAHDLVFRYRAHGAPVLQGVNLQIRAGDRLLVEGPSGGGKSTLASLLIGLRCPESGLLLLDGLDRQTWGAEGWRRRVVAAPQFHENHVLTGTFAFNLFNGSPLAATSQ
ncbi:MAG: ABC transporter ATP-binding protein [Deltaproteobacteria bacterium]|nr:ABC transporter ATP-binding protein [Deltaproteobacteria bacterium]